MNTIKFLQKNASHSLLWNSFEAFFYQFFLLTHQCFLFWYSDKLLYGLQGALFATIYLTITFLNGAFDTALTAIFHDIKTDKFLFKKIAFTALAQQAFFLFVTGLLGCTIAIQCGFPPFLKEYTHPFWILLLSLFIASEGTKKNIRALLHLGFKNKETATIESLNIMLYVVSIWTLYWLGIPFSLTLLTVPFVIVSLLTNLLLIDILYKYTHNLTDSKEKTTQSLQEFKKTRLFLYSNDIMKSLFSSNFLMPFFASLLGLQQAGVASFINFITHSMTFFIQKIFGPSSAALFAHSKYLTFENKQELFSYLTRKCMLVLASLLFIATLSSSTLLTFKINIFTASSWFLIYCFFIAHLLENMFVIYEKFFISQNKAYYVTFCNTISFISCAILIAFTTHHSLITTLLLCITTRLIAFFGLTFLAYKQYNLSFKSSFFKV